jgi:hypothetical protein
LLSAGGSGWVALLWSRSAPFGEQAAQENLAELVGDLFGSGGAIGLEPQVGVVEHAQDPLGEDRIDLPELACAGAFDQELEPQAFVLVPLRDDLLVEPVGESHVLAEEDGPLAREVCNVHHQDTRERTHAALGRFISRDDESRRLEELVDGVAADGEQDRLLAPDVVVETAAAAVDRAMRTLGLVGVRRDKKVRTTIPAKDGNAPGTC